MNLQTLIEELPGKVAAAVNSAIKAIFPSADAGAGQPAAAAAATETPAAPAPAPATDAAAPAADGPEAARLKTENDQLRSKCNEALADIARLEAAQKTVGQQAATIAAAAGHAQLPIAEGPTGAAGKQSTLLEQINAITDPLARAKFIAEHRAQLRDAQKAELH